MKKIKFKVWDVNKKVMSPVAKINYADDGFAETIIIEPAPKGKYHYGLVHGESGFLLEYTTVPDKNENEICEADIVVVPYGKGEVVKHHGCFMIAWLDDKEANMEILGIEGKFGRPRVDIEVIGNIYETPDLVNQPTQ